MDLTKALSETAARRPHVLLVEVPGWSHTRIFTERELLRRGWIESSSPADSDILLTCGTPSDDLSEVLDRVWDQFPGPRVRVKVHDPTEVVDVLDQARKALVNCSAQQKEAFTRTAAKVSPAVAAQSSSSDNSANPGADDGGMDHAQMAHGETAPGADDGEVDHSGMDHSQMDMPMPGGIGLAEAGADRDGLDLDVLHVSLGPVLRYWPAGLVVRCALQGDVITEASVDLMTGSPTVNAPGVGERSGSLPEAGGDRARLLSVRYCDQVVSLLALMGWDRFALRCSRVRDGLLGGMPLEDAVSELNALGRGISRSKTFRWSFKDLPEILERLDVLVGRARWVLEADTPFGKPALWHTAHEESARLQQVPGMIVGLDLFAARLIIASLGLDTVVAARVGGVDA
ncbi:hypothetical protein E8P82_14025 [Arthrobacter echini]|uniref:Uncharacterized protein n=2 Tax=Arthrobacter echini TaxID=1529066 RepID=A0A4S5E0J3_9MICC|nr:hypothetical protein [Arthrobacter echini]THJ64807.1 hypothetical protein E8P82_14025 [Arthrobacter echini]TYC97134.1 hypothetical protein FQ377_13250 [Arthrobacter echini]